MDRVQYVSRKALILGHECRPMAIRDQVGRTFPRIGQLLGSDATAGTTDFRSAVRELQCDVSTLTGPFACMHNEHQQIVDNQQVLLQNTQGILQNQNALDAKLDVMNGKLDQILNYLKAHFQPPQ